MPGCGVSLTHSPATRPVATAAAVLRALSLNAHPPVSSTEAAVRATGYLAPDRTTFIPVRTRTDVHAKEPQRRGIPDLTLRQELLYLLKQVCVCVSV